jgi:hypothetical protein
MAHEGNGSRSGYGRKPRPSLSSAQSESLRFFEVYSEWGERFAWPHSSAHPDEPVPEHEWDDLYRRMRSAQTENELRRESARLRSFVEGMARRLLGSASAPAARRALRPRAAIVTRRALARSPAISPGSLASAPSRRAPSPPAATLPAWNGTVEEWLCGADGRSGAFAEIPKRPDEKFESPKAADDYSRRILREMLERIWRRAKPSTIRKYFRAWRRARVQKKRTP